MKTLGPGPDQRLPEVGGLRQGRTSPASRLHLVQQPADDGRGNRVDEALLPIPRPIHLVARAPTRFALDAVLEVHDDLELSQRVDARFVNASGANMPEALLGNAVFAR